MKLKFEPLQDLGTKSRNVQQTIQYDTVDVRHCVFFHTIDVVIEYIYMLCRILKKVLDIHRIRLTT